MRAGRQTRWAMASVSVFALGLAGSQVALTTTAFSATASSAGDTWTAATLSPVSRLSATPTCTRPSPVSVVATSHASRTAGAVTLPVPTQTRAGDLLVVQVVHDGDSTPAPGFTLLQDVKGTANFQARIYQRVAAPGDAGTQASFAMSAGRGSGLLVVVRGAAAPVSTDAAGTGDGNTASVRAPSVTASAPDVLLVSLFGQKQQGTTFSTPAGMSPLVAEPGSAGTSDAAFSQQLTATGATGTRTSTASSSGHAIGQTLALRPAGSPAAAPTLSWTASPTPGVDGYQVLENGTVVATVPAGTTSWTEPVPPATPRTYGVRATAATWLSSVATVSAGGSC